MTDFDWDDYAPTLDPEEEARQHAKRLALQHVFTGSDLNAEEFPPVEWIIPGLIPEGYGLLVGPPKIGKSWFTYDLALNVARGGTILGGIRVKRRPVFLLAMEDGKRRLKDRARTLLGDAPIPANLYFQTKRTPDVLTATIPAWLTDHGHEKPLIIIDTLQTVSPPMGSRNAYEYDYKRGEILSELVAPYPGTGLLVIHHTNTGQSSDWMDGTSGSNGVNGSAEFTLMLRSERGSDEGVLHVTGRDVAGGSYGVTFNGGLWNLDGGGLAEAAEAARDRAAKMGLGDLSQQILTALDAANRPLTAKDVVGLVPGLSDDNARKILGRLEKSGRIAKVSRGTYVTNRYVTPPVTTVPSVTSREDPPTIGTLGTHVTPPLEDPTVTTGRLLADDPDAA